CRCNQPVHYTARMADQPDQRPRDRYDVSGNSEAQYVDAAQRVLKNRKAITELRTLQVEEEKGLARAYERLLGEVRSDTPITTEFIGYVHGMIFRDLYDWAGRWRTVRISKPGVSWPPAGLPRSGDAGLRAGRPPAVSGL